MNKFTFTFILRFITLNSDSSSAGQEIPRLLWKLKFRYRLYNSSPPDSPYPEPAESSPHILYVTFLYRMVYPKVSGLSRQRNEQQQKYTLVEKQHKVLWRQNSLD
jgi:hypothetical protein